MPSVNSKRHSHSIPKSYQLIVDASVAIGECAYCKYMNHISRAEGRGICFDMTFPEWWGVWEASGKWAERGNRSSSYCMSRVGDKGGYEVGNVFINTNFGNISEAHIGRKNYPGGKNYKRRPRDKNSEVVLSILWLRHKARMTYEDIISELAAQGVKTTNGSLCRYASSGIRPPAKIESAILALRASARTEE